jgi:cytochrome P450
MRSQIVGGEVFPVSPRSGAELHGRQGDQHPWRPWLQRRRHAPERIGGLALPAGTSVGANAYAARRPDVWPNPDRFDPTRFVGTRPSPFTFFPFGGGIRRCLAFATYEMKIVLTEVLSRVDLRLASGYRMRPRLRGVTVAPSRGVPVVVERRLDGP